MPQMLHFQFESDPGDIGGWRGETENLGKSLRVERSEKKLDGKTKHKL